MKIKVLRSALAGVLISGLTAFSSQSFAANDAMLQLIDVLHANGTIDADAYSVLKNYVAADKERMLAHIDKVASEKVSDVKEVTDKMAWASRIKLQGDLRLRRQWQNVDDSADPSRTRYRYRARFGAEGQVVEDVSVAIGFASGGVDPRSTNETMDDNFESKGLVMDYAYAKWEANDFAILYGGKMKRKPILWAPTDLLWDGDINPEGFAAHLQTKNGIGKIYANIGHFFLEEEKADGDDQNLTFLQIGQKFKSADVFGNLAATYYAFDNQEGAGYESGVSAGTNSLTDGKATYEYDSYSLAAELGMKLSATKMAVVFAEYIQADDPSDDETGYALGFKFGDSKVKKLGQWQVKYIHADLERDAWADIFPDSDRCDGGTGFKSDEVSFKLGLAKNINFGLDYYDSECENYSGGANEDSKILQADLQFKFK
ncbi:MAG: putative porin [Gammaproteobacteria bacterium]|nr:putative porin [Gammaproteobacteria bacterium]